MTGQDAVNVAKSFDETLGIDGIVLTKLDGRYPRRVRRFRSGQSPASRSSSSAPAKSSTTWSPSIPTAWPPRILGMGDVLTLIEKAQSAVDEQKALEMAQKLKEQSFDMNDLPRADAADPPDGLAEPGDQHVPRRRQGVGRGCRRR